MLKTTQYFVHIALDEAHSQALPMPVPSTCMTFDLPENSCGESGELTYHMNDVRVERR